MTQATQPGTRTPRILSLDIFRGLNIALMIFVNELSEMKGLPWWTHHAPASVNVMTYVDMVFPGFLIIVGMSLPLALAARTRRGDNTPKLLWYIFLRSAALIVLGLVIENGPLGSAAHMHGLGADAWSLLALAGCFLLWMDYPRTEDTQRRSTYRILRAVGALVLLVLFCIYRRVDSHTGTQAWLTFGYPEILGLIGYSYLVAGICYIATRKWLWAPLGWFLGFLTLNVLSAARIVETKHPWWFWPVQNGSMPALIFAGVVLSIIFLLEPRLNTFARKLTVSLLFAAIAAVAGLLLTPLGISKIRATPTWVLYDVAACCVIYGALYFLCDVKKKTAWAAPFFSAGSNTLVTYLLPDIWFFACGALGVTWLSTHLNVGSTAVLRSAVFVVLMLAASTLLTRLRVRLQL